MHAQSLTIIVSVIVILIGVSPWNILAHAERLPKSDLDSTIQPECDLCWNPSLSEQHPDRLPTFRRHRRPRPPDSRPHRLPKGHYKLVPNQKHSRLSMLRARSRRNTRFASTQQAFAIDGDTLRIGSERIRLRGIDTSELSEPEGQAAKQRLEELLRSGPIRIVPHGRDVYDRLVADVFVDGRNIADLLIREGYSKSHAEGWSIKRSAP
jgi:endonuclease YncB( thermonuclease family)